MVNSSLAEKRDYHVPIIRVIDLPKEEIKWCTVSLSDVMKAGKRLEAAVFEAEGKQARQAIADCKYKSLPLTGNDGVSAAYTCGRFKRVWIESSEFPIFQPSSITDIYPTPDGYLSEITRADFDALRVHDGQVLLTCSGTIGKVALVSRTLDNKIFSHDLIRVTANDVEDAGYIYAFLRSKIGNTLLQTNNYGAVIQHIEAEHLADIPVPNPPIEIKRQINDLIMRSFALRDQSNELIDKATDLLQSELGLPPIQEIETKRFDNSCDVNNYNVRLSDIQGRLDGSYHVPIVEAITKHLEEHSAEITTISDERISSDILLPGRFKRVYVSEGQGVVFFSGKNIMELDPSDKRHLSFSQHESRIREQLTIRNNMILVTCSGTVGKVTFVPKHWDGWAMTHDIIRIIPNERVKGYLFIWLQSKYAKTLIEAKAYGSVVPHIELSHIAPIPVPFLKDQHVQDEINNLALETSKLRYEAYQLEQKAMNAMNDEVIFAK